MTLPCGKKVAPSDTCCYFYDREAFHSFQKRILVLCNNIRLLSDKKSCETLLTTLVELIDNAFRGNACTAFEVRPLNDKCVPVFLSYVLIDLRPLDWRKLLGVRRV